jgi:hypothetical protein
VVTDDVSVTSEFEQGTDNIQMVCQSKNYFNIGDLV